MFGELLFKVGCDNVARGILFESPTYDCGALAARWPLSLAALLGGGLLCGAEVGMFSLFKGLESVLKPLVCRLEVLDFLVMLDDLFLDVCDLFVECLDLFINVLDLSLCC